MKPVFAHYKIKGEPIRNNECPTITEEFEWSTHYERISQEQFNNLKSNSIKELVTFPYNEVRESMYQHFDAIYAWIESCTNEFQIQVCRSTVDTFSQRFFKEIMATVDYHEVTWLINKLSSLITKKITSLPK